MQRVSMAYLSQLRATGSVEEPVEKWSRVTSRLNLSPDQQARSQCIIKWT